MFKTGFYKCLSEFKSQYTFGSLPRDLLIHEYNAFHKEDTDLRLAAEEGLRREAAHGGYLGALDFSLSETRLSCGE
jgi:hypothetical protein